MDELEQSCATCAYWSSADAEVDWDAAEVGMRRCMGVRERWHIADEAAPKHGGSEDYAERRAAALKAAKAYVQDGSEYRADLVTGPDFSCALYMPQEAPKILTSSEDRIWAGDFLRFEGERGNSKLIKATSHNYDAIAVEFINDGMTVELFRSADGRYWAKRAATRHI